MASLWKVQWQPICIENDAFWIEIIYLLHFTAILTKAMCHKKAQIISVSLRKGESVKPDSS